MGVTHRQVVSWSGNAESFPGRWTRNGVRAQPRTPFFVISWGIGPLLMSGGESDVMYVQERNSLDSAMSVPGGKRAKLALEQRHLNWTASSILGMRCFRVQRADPTQSLTGSSVSIPRVRFQWKHPR